MKSLRGIPLGMTLLVLGALGCASQKGFEADPPFRISDPVVRDWTGGREASGSGTVLSMRWVPEDPEAMVLETLYFRGRALDPRIEDTDTGMRLTASYTRTPLQVPDRVMHADSTREVGNQPPMPLPETQAMPFELERDQAVLAYTRKADGRTYYFRIDGIVEKPGRILPTRPQN
ncbi:hypothetical protein OZ410_03885 [Robiginitalea sp. M366]|uniref:hypothetical protein n=1 Tax=Robiginitalea aestuariiviva TaxID=3036903 RepID=UPI00240E6500|nr:hypothetical protein [Robiginitalea aestuariiviva]MDG1571442.1 hypothetical protein [Robiginitalea aestuariiviva]